MASKQKDTPRRRADHLWLYRRYRNFLKGRRLAQCDLGHITNEFLSRDGGMKKLTSGFLWPSGGRAGPRPPRIVAGRLHRATLADYRGGASDKTSRRET